MWFQLSVLNCSNHEIEFPKGRKFFLMAFGMRLLLLEITNASARENKKYHWY